MLKKYLLLFFLFISSLALGKSESKAQLVESSPVVNCQQSTLTVAWHRYYPYSFLHSESGELLGNDVSLIANLLNKMGCKHSFIYMTWARTLTEIDKGNVDIGMYAFKNQKREKRFVFTEPYRSESVRIAILNENKAKWTINNLSDFEKYDLLVAADTHVYAGQEYEEFKNMNSGKHIIHIHGIERRVKMLLSGRVDAIIGDPLSIKYEVDKQTKENRYFIDEFIIYNNPVRFIFKKDKFDKAFIERLNLLISK
jgi:polar amino acid transport system substrate-binding protein